MIIDKQPLPDDPTPYDAPPSYDTLTRALELAARSPGFEKPSAVASSSLISPISPTSSRAKPNTFLRSSSSRGKGKGPSNWFNFSSRFSSTREVRSTVLGLIRDLVRQPHQHQRVSTPATMGILESCAEACAAYDISFSSLLQEKSIEEHTPLYWAIIKRPPETPHPEPNADVPDFLTTLLSYCGVLSPETRSEMRLACLLTSDQALFQRLRLSHEFAPLSGTDEILLGASMPPDEIVVGDVPGDQGAFVVNFGVVLFQQRMRISRRIDLEFIARGRLWCLSFFVATGSPRRQCNINIKPGSWYISLSLLQHSPPTWLDSRIIIEEPPRPPSSLPPYSNDEASSPPGSPTCQNPRTKPKPTITFRFNSGMTQLIAPQDTSWLGESQNEIIVSLDASMMGSGLQYAGSSYILPDGMLRARLEARLAKAEAECIIC